MTRRFAPSRCTRLAGQIGAGVVIGGGFFMMLLLWFVAVGWR